VLVGILNYRLFLTFNRDTAHAHRLQLVPRRPEWVRQNSRTDKYLRERDLVNLTSV